MNIKRMMSALVILAVFAASSLSAAKPANPQPQNQQGQVVPEQHKTGIASCLQGAGIGTAGVIVLALIADLAGGGGLVTMITLKALIGGAAVGCIGDVLHEELNKPQKVPSGEASR